MEILSDEDLSLRLGGETTSLGALCREIGEIEQTYADSFRTFRQDFAYGKVSVYLRAIERPLPEQWRDWIG